MRIRNIFLVMAIVACLLPASVGAGEEQVRQFSGKILLDVENHGEAWYVNPQTLQRTYLGRPEEALYRLSKLAVWVDFVNIERIAEDGAASPDPAYAERMAGYVLAPNDLLGAAWYVHPVLRVRLRLGIPDDAWRIMRAGVPVSAKLLKTIPVEPEVEFVPSGEQKVREVVATDRIVLEDNTEIRLMSVDAPGNVEYQIPAKARLQSLIDGNGGVVCLEADRKDEATDGSKLRMVRAGETLLNLEVVRMGWAFHSVEPPNFRNAEMMIVGGIDAQTHGNGFWGK